MTPAKHCVPTQTNTAGTGSNPGSGIADVPGNRAVSRRDGRQAGANSWLKTWRADPRAAALADRHYSRKSVGASQFAPPGSVLVLVTAAGDAVWVSWRTDYPDADWLRDAWCCTLFRNEGGGLSSDLIRSAVAATRAEWGDPPAGGTVTMVDAAKVRRKRDPGRCFIRAGFKRLPELTKDRGLVILRLAVADHPTPVHAAHTQMELAG